MKGQVTHPAAKELILRLYYESDSLPTKRIIADILGISYATVVDITNREKLTEPYIVLAREWDEVTNEIRKLAGWPDEGEIK